MAPKKIKLNYVLNKPRGPITLDLFEAERYEAAVIVQQLIGNLVYYSNQGRYEPRLAKNWAQVTPKKWRFELREGFECENGEVITPESFAQSITRTLRVLSKKYPVPVFRKLVGYDEFVEGQSEFLPGISVDTKDIVFEFISPVRSGILQMLSFAPFGYISRANFNESGEKWKSSTSFISSGPYKVDNIVVGEKYILSRNPKWGQSFLEGAPDEIHFSHEIPQSDKGGHWIIDSARQKLDPPEWLEEYSLVPEYLNPILFGNLSSGYFSDPSRRKRLAQVIDEFRSELPSDIDAHTPSENFYPNQQLNRIPVTSTLQKLPPNDTPIIIEGKEPAQGAPAYYAWVVLRKALDKEGLKYRFNNNEMSAKYATDRRFDIRLRGASIGGEVEPWGIGLLFCSDLGIKFPDPSRKICSLVEKYESGDIEIEQFTEAFFAQLQEDSAIIPITHFGVRLFLSDSIRQETLSPALNIVRMDQLGVE